MAGKEPGSKNQGKKVTTHSTSKMRIMPNVPHPVFHSVDRIKHITNPKNICRNRNGNKKQVQVHIGIQ